MGFVFGAHVSDDLRSVGPMENTRSVGSLPAGSDIDGNQWGFGSGYSDLKRSKRRLSLGREKGPPFTKALKR